MSAQDDNLIAVHVFEQRFRAEIAIPLEIVVANTDVFADMTFSVTVQLRALVASLMTQFAHMENKRSQTRRSSAPSECHLTAYLLILFHILFSYHL